MLLPTGRHWGQAGSSTSDISLLVSYARASCFYESRQMTVLLCWAPEDRGQMVQLYEAADASGGKSYCKLS